MKTVRIERYTAKSFHTSEAIRTLRTNLLCQGEKIRSIALTCYSASEGKLEGSLQLAISMAQAGKRVLLLDADLRKGTLSSRLNTEGDARGLSHFLSGTVGINDMLFETDVKGLYVIFAGKQVANAAELLGRKRFGELIEKLKSVFDYIIVDTPPLGQVIDCAVLASAVDGILTVVDVNHNSYKLERKMHAQLKTAGGNILGVVLSGVNSKDKHSFYGKASRYDCG